IFFFILSSCTTPSTPPDTLSIPIPSRWSQDLNAQATPWLAAQLRVYELPTQTKVHATTMQVDEVNGTVKAKSFKLPGGKTYKFIIEFQYLTPGQPIAFAYAEVEKEIGDGNAETVTFTSSDIRYEVDKQDPNISASISQGILPDLDPDNDGWSTYQELKDGVSPLNGQDIPKVPTVQITLNKIGEEIEITLQGQDNKRVEGLKLADPLCGVRKMSEQGLGTNQAKVVYRLDLRSIDEGYNQRNIQAIIWDGVTANQTGSQETAPFSIKGDESHVSFVFTEPEEGTELEGITTLQGIACGRKEIMNFKIRFNGEELTGYDVAMSLGDYGEKKVIISNLNTELIPDGEVEIQGESIDGSDIKGQGIGKYKITNKSAIKVKQPEGRKWIYGAQSLSFSVVGEPSAKSLTVEHSGQGELSSLSTTDVNGTALLNVKNATEGSKESFTIRSYDGNDVLLAERTVTFEVRNNPQIKQFNSEWVQGPTGFDVKLNYEVLNANSISIGQNEILCGLEGSPVKNIKICKGSVQGKLQQAGDNHYVLTATRGDSKSSQDIPVEGVGAYFPRYGVVSNKNDEAPNEIKLPNSGSYRLKAIRLNKQLQEGSTDFEKEDKDGAIIPLDKTQLQPRTDYKIRLEKLTKPQGNVLGTMEKIVTTGDKDLVLWLRFNEDPSKKEICEGGDAGEYVCDYSGNNNHGIPQGDPEWLEPPQSGLLGGALQFDGVNNMIVIEDSPSLMSVFNELTIKVSLKPEGFVEENFDAIIDRSDDGNSTFAMSFGNMAKLKWGVKLNEDSYILIGDENPVVAGERVVYIGQYKVGTSRLFRDGILVAMENGPMLPLANGSVTIRIGYHEFWKKYFNGIIDELIMLNKNLSDSEIQNSYQADEALLND
ncbi:MAG: hypothetical protein HYU97_01605, partial [Deltaproteobacteria bacterium]|nr:hypothetical protein [Deltaproteobacteria bacterium]